MTKKKINVQDDEKDTAKTLQDLQLLHELQERFKQIWGKAEANEAFGAHCDNLGIERQHRQYIVASILDNGGLKQTERCKLLGIEFNRRHHRKYHDDPKNKGVILFGMNCLDLTSSKQKQSITAVLEDIIHGESRATDKVKAIESYLKIQEKQHGASTLKPWERLWNETLIPALHRIYCEDKGLEQ